MPDGRPTRFFLRDDDVGALTPELQGFMDVFATRGLPVSYQIIPAALTEDCAAYLRGRRTKAGNLFEFAQHGLTHEMTVGGRQVFYEFGPERTYSQQLDIILEGQAILDRSLGADFNRDVFTPPQHKYDRNTLLALKAAGVKVLSASKYDDPARRLTYGIGRALRLSSLGRHGISHHGRVRPDGGLLELSVTVTVDNAARRSDSVDEVLGAIRKAQRHTDVVGLMFHHNAYKSAADQAFLGELADRLLTLEAASFHLLGELAGLILPE